MKIRVLNQQDMQKVFTMEEAIKAAGDALAMYSAGNTDIPLRANINVAEHGGNSLYMYGYAAPAQALGVKIVSVYSGNAAKGLPVVPATMVLLNSATGQVCALMDGTYLTRARTGAVAGAATQLLARRDCKVFALIGTGGQAEGQLEAVLTVRPGLEKVLVYSRNFEKADAFAKAMAAKFGEKFSVEITAVHSSEEAVKDADIITAVTTANNAVFDGRLIKKGVHINAMGSYTPDMAEIDEYIVTTANKIYTDTNEGVISESGDIIQPMEKGTFRESDITGELGQAINGAVAGRESDDELTLFESVGTAVLDIVTAQRIYERAEELNVGSVIEL